jgi:hypothetical protein
MIDMLTGAYTMDDLDRTKIEEAPETNIGKLFSIHGGALHIIHEQSDRVLLWDDIDNAKGEALDRYGANFGVQRQGTRDPFYRLLIKVKMLAQLSGGDVDTVLNAASILLNVDPDKLDLREVFPAKVYIYIDRDELTDDTMILIDLIWQMLHRIVAAGIWLRIFLRTYVSGETDVIVHTGGRIAPEIFGEQFVRSTEGEIHPHFKAGMRVSATIRMAPSSPPVRRDY